MASQNLYEQIQSSYYNIINNNSTLVPAGSNAEDLNIKIVTIIPGSVSSFSATMADIVTLNSSSVHVSNTISGDISSSNCASQKFIIN